jgi:hypothetical protein
MTGGEILPVGKAAFNTAQKALSEEPSVKEQLARMAAESPAMKAAAESYARRIAIKQGLLLKLYAPLAKWVGASKDYFEGQFAEDMSSKIADIPQESLRSPHPSVAVPAMQGLGYSLDEPSLKYMYLNLLATATDSRQGDHAHPSFAEIIKQLSGAEARLLSNVLRMKLVPIVRVKVTVPGGDGYTVALNHLVDLVIPASRQRVENPSAPVWIDNWERLGLVTADYTQLFTAPGKYSWVDERPEVVRLRQDGAVVSFDQGILRATDFGSRFAAAVGLVVSKGEAADAEPSPSTSEG